MEQRKRELLLATKLGAAATVKGLLQGGVDANSADVNGISALLWAATSGDAETIKALLGAGAVVRNTGKPGPKVLLYYLYYGVEYKRVIDEEVVQGLVKAGADINAVDINGTTPLMLATQSGNAGIVKHLESAGANASNYPLECTGFSF